VKKLNVKATFFMVGSHVKSDNLAKIVRTIKYNYPQVLLANHSTSHANNKYQYFYHHPAMAAEDFYLAQKTLKVPYKIIRLPGNSAWVVDSVVKASGLVKPVCHLLDSSGYNVIGWDVEWNFNHKTAYPVQRPYKIAEQVDTALARNHVHTKNHVVILAHDRMFRKENFTDSLTKFINILKQDPRNVFETIKKDVKQYRSDQPIIGGIKHGEPIYDFWQAIVDDDSERLLSEDYQFCKLWKQSGGKIYLAPYIKVTHVGTYWFK
jgi:hypothetical protein